jgi:hypothetical protein
MLGIQLQNDAMAYLKFNLKFKSNDPFPAACRLPLYLCTALHCTALLFEILEAPARTCLSQSEYNGR